jgi:hypothetical protein
MGRAPRQQMCCRCAQCQQAVVVPGLLGMLSSAPDMACHVAHPAVSTCMLMCPWQRAARYVG